MTADILSRSTIQKMLISIGLISGLLISWKLWITERLFPHFPVWDALTPFASPLDKVLFGVILGFLLFSLVRPKALWATRTLFALLIFIALQDQMRWQPWYYQYLLMLLPFLMFKSPWSSEHAKAVLWIQQMILISVYLWGGIHKAHEGFLSVYNNSLIKPLLELTDNNTLESLLKSFGYLIPPIEFLTGIALLFNRTRKLGVWMAIATHVLIIVLLGPVKGYISNIVVWPWNVVMIAMVITSFYNVPVIKWSTTAPTKALGRIRYLVLLLIFVAPFFFYAGKWDRYLSFNLYSGRQKRMLVYVKDDASAKLPAGLEPYYRETNQQEGFRVLLTSIWVSEELKVALITEDRIFQRLSEHFCEYGIGESELIFYTDYKHLPDKGHKVYQCSDVAQR